MVINFVAYILFIILDNSKVLCVITRLGEMGIFHIYIFLLCLPGFQNHQEFPVQAGDCVRRPHKAGRNRY